MPSRNRSFRRITERRTQAEARAEARGARSNQEQLRVLIARGHGHCAEAQRLAAEIAQGKA